MTNKCGKCGTSELTEGSQGLMAADKFNGVCLICHSAAMAKERYEKGKGERYWKQVR